MESSVPPVRPPLPLLGEIRSLQGKRHLHQGTPVLITDRHLNQYKEVLENGVYVKQFVGNKWKQGSLTEQEADYYLDNKPCLIEEGLYLGSVDAARNRDELIRLRITHIINVTTDEQAYPQEFQYICRPMDDLPDAPLLDRIHELVPIMLHTLSPRTADPASGISAPAILVHCTQGVSRSASIVLAYLMARHGMSFADAYQRLQLLRPSIRPNYGFENQLRIYEAQLGHQP